MRKFIIILLACIFLLTGCMNNHGFLTGNIYAMNTVISINIPADTKEGNKLIENTENKIYKLEQLFSATVEQSEVSLFNKADVSYKLSNDTLEVIKIALDVAKNTNGAYDPTCLILTQLWNIGGGGNLPAKEEISEALKNTDYSALQLKDTNLIKDRTKIKIDLGGIAKGYSLQKCVEDLSENTDYGMISFGGNVGVWGQKPDGSPWQIGIKNPYDTSTTVGLVTLEDVGYISVSGDYERYFEKDGVRYHHIFDPKTGYPVENGIHSVAVYAKNAALGDALSTALFVMGYEDAIELYKNEIYEFEALFITDTGIEMTEGMKKMFTENHNEN